MPPLLQPPPGELLVTSLRIGIACYPSVGGSGILATALGVELARLGHEVHFVTYEPPFRLPTGEPRVTFHPVAVQGYGIFKHEDYTLPLAVTLANVARTHSLDLIHAHYAVPHATAAVLAQEFLAEGAAPRVVTTLHGTDTFLLGRDSTYAPAIRHALQRTDGLTAVSESLRRDTLAVLDVPCSLEVIPNFYDPRSATRSRAVVRSDLGVEDDEALLVHVSNLRPIKRFDLLLAALARLPAQRRFRLAVIAGGDFAPFEAEVARLGLADRVVVRTQVAEVEDYLAAADLNLISSEYESFCLSVLEAMAFAVPSVATTVGGIPEVIESGVQGLLVPFGDVDALSRAIESLLADTAWRQRMGRAAQERARTHFSPEVVVPRYLDLYRRVLEGKRR